MYIRLLPNVRSIHCGPNKASYRTRNEIVHESRLVALQSLIRTSNCRQIPE